MGQQIFLKNFSHSIGMLLYLIVFWIPFLQMVEWCLPGIRSEAYEEILVKGRNFQL